MGMSGSSTVSPKLARIAQLASEDPERVLTSLAHHIDRDLLVGAFARVRKNAAPGVDGQTTADFARDLDANLETLREGWLSGRYKAPPVKRAFVPKPAGGERPIGRRPLRTRCCSVRWSWCWRPSTNRTFWTARMAFGRVGPRTAPCRCFGTG